MEKKANFPMKKRFWPIFSRIFECYKPQGTNCKGPKGILGMTVEAIRASLQRMRGCWKLKFMKKRKSFQ